ncbi:MAG TPA: glycoside hydrolase family 66 protein [Acidimicrobiales bacterium]|nr:glycoside hydrolase family 66 protein [Acidimicrobiales bacterium]
MPASPYAPAPRLEELRAFYQTGEGITLSRLPAGTARVVARYASGEVQEADVGLGAHFGRLRTGTTSVEAIAADGSVLAEELTTVAAHAGERPVHGFATSFDPQSVPSFLTWLKALRCTVVQIYDWMASYSAPLGPPEGWEDPSRRPVSYEALRALAVGIRSNGAVAHAYAPVYAVDLPFAADHPDWLMYRNDGKVQRFFDMIELANPGNVEWQRHFAFTYGSAADSIGFDGFHVDTYGYPRSAVDRDGKAIDIRSAYESFLAFFRRARPSDQISFNQVNGVPSAIELPPGPGFRYCEVWAPNDQWRHLEGLMDRSSGKAGQLAQPPTGGPISRGSIACYPPVWEKNGRGGPQAVAPREESLRTVVLTEAIATCMGASALLFGDVTSVLCDPYYPKHERLSASEAATVLAWHRFGLRCRDLFLEGEDTSWYEIGDENGAVAVKWDGPVRPEPVGGTLFARVVRTDGCVAVGVVDLSGSADGSWSQPTAMGRCRSVRVRALLEHPDSWQAAAAVLGRSGDRFAPVPFTMVEHREGRALQVDVPVEAGWSVLRFTR